MEIHFRFCESCETWEYRFETTTLCPWQAVTGMDGQGFYAALEELKARRCDAVTLVPTE